MIAPKKATNISASLERSLQNCSLNQTTTGDGGSSPTDAPEDLLFSGTSAVELNSNLQLPSHWQQFLDLKTGEIYYIDLTTGVRRAGDPRTSPAPEHDGRDSEVSYSEEKSSSYENESEQSTSVESSSQATLKEESREEEEEDNVLVVGGCKRCFMYVMVPKRAQHCPKCSGQLLRFDGSETASDP